jgi:hypothetical protein
MKLAFEILWPLTRTSSAMKHADIFVLDSDDLTHFSSLGRELDVHVHVLEGTCMSSILNSHIVLDLIGRNSELSSCHVSSASSHLISRLRLSGVRLEYGDGIDINGEQYEGVRTTMKMVSCQRRRFRR